MSFWERIASLFKGGGSSGNRLLDIYVLSRRCNEPIAGQVDLFNELSRTEEDGGGNDEQGPDHDVSREGEPEQSGPCGPPDPADAGHGRVQGPIPPAPEKGMPAGKPGPSILEGGA